jgi:hypothetical protein
MYSAPLSLSELRPFALELTLLVMVGSMLTGAFASAILLRLAGLVSEGFPLPDFSFDSYFSASVQFQRLGKVQ